VHGSTVHGSTVHGSTVHGSTVHATVHATVQITMEAGRSYRQWAGFGMCGNRRELSMKTIFHRFHVVALIGGLLAGWPSSSVAAPTAKQALTLKPMQRDVEFDTPTDDEIAKCTIELTDGDGASAWVVRSPNRTLLRRFVDTNGDNKIDNWCYYQAGSEVYRDVDTDFDERADQFRWMGLEGLRWGIDENSDGLIDRWLNISAEEVTLEVVAAIKDALSRDPRVAGQASQRFAGLLPTKSELKKLGLGPSDSARIGRQIQDAVDAFGEAAKSQDIVSPETEWMHFFASKPGILPKGTDGSTQDVVVYENAAAILETGDGDGQLAIGTLVKLGDSWRLIGLPAGLLPADVDSTELTLLLQSSGAANLANAGPPPGALAEGMRKLIAQQQRVAETLRRTDDPSKRRGLYKELLSSQQTLAEQSTSRDDRLMWIRQMADTISEAMLGGDITDGNGLFGEIMASIPDIPGKSDVEAYITYRQIQAEYTLQTQQSDNENFGRVHEVWLKRLTAFVKRYPDSNDGLEAMLQLGLAEEFSGNEEEAIDWYRQVEKKGGENLYGKKAAGAINRLESVGKEFSLSGRTVAGDKFDLGQLKGNLVLVHYWATYGNSTAEDVNRLKKLYAIYEKKGLRILGVNLDHTQESLEKFLKQSRSHWPNLHEEGGFDSRLAVQMGVFTVPTMILVDVDGKVVNRNIHVAELEKVLVDRTKKR